MAATYPSLSRAQLSYDYLHTNSTTHEFLFGAIVELVDNARDANANRLDIFTVARNDLRGGRMLCFCDDGCGMTSAETKNVITFGYSAKRRDPNMIGQYGNGLKSGAMRIAKDMILFTKKAGEMTCLALSRTFHEEEGLTDEVIIPIPSFSINGEPLIVNDDDQAKYDQEMEIILKYSPFKTLDELITQFGFIKSDTGTLVICYNLKLIEDGQPELDFVRDPCDIWLSDPDGIDSIDDKLHLEKTSLRAYLSVIYLNPRMKLYIQSKKVRTRRIVNCLYRCIAYKFSSAKFKARANKQVQEYKLAIVSAQEKVKEVESKATEFENKYGSNSANKIYRAEGRKLRENVVAEKKKLQALKAFLDEQTKQLKQPKEVTFIFGFNIERRAHDGCFIYNNGRLIRMYEKYGLQTENTRRGAGVVGVVDIPFILLEPTHNKQDFADNREYRQLLRAMTDHMEQYWRDLNLAAQPGGLVEFWKGFGYLSNDWNAPPSMDQHYILKRLFHVRLSLQCDLCLKWRILPFQKKQATIEIADTWMCSLNPDPDCNRCSCPEKFPTIESGRLEKATISVEEKTRNLAKTIEKHKAQLDSMKNLKSVNSKRDLIVQNKIQKQAPTAKIPLKQNEKRKNRSPSPSLEKSKKPKTKAELRKQMEEEEEEEEEEDGESEEQEGSSTESEIEISDDEDAKAIRDIISSKKTFTTKKSTSNVVDAKRTRTTLANTNAKLSNVGTIHGSSPKLPAIAKNTAIGTCPTSLPIHNNGLCSKTSGATTRNSVAQKCHITRQRLANEMATSELASIDAESSDERQMTHDSPSSSLDNTLNSINISVSSPMKDVKFPLLKLKQHLQNGSSIDSTEERLNSSSSRNGKMDVSSNEDSFNQDQLSTIQPNTIQDHNSNNNKDPSPTAEEFQQLADCLKRCLLFFMPPESKITRLELEKMTTRQLIHEFNYVGFFTTYEQGLKKLVAEQRRSRNKASDTSAKLEDNADTLQQQHQDSLAKIQRLTAELNNNRQNMKIILTHEKSNLIDEARIQQQQPSPPQQQRRRQQQQQPTDNRDVNDVALELWAKQILDSIV